MSLQAAALDVKVVWEINTRYKAVRDLRRKHVEGIVEFGKFLNRTKDKLGHGCWIKVFTSKALDIDDDTARFYMAIAKNKVLANPENYRYLPATVSTLYRLSSPRLDEEVLRAALKRG